MTAVAGILKNGVGPVVAIRFDIDALGLVEDSTDGHYPKQEGFSSCHLGLTYYTSLSILLDVREEFVLEYVPLFV